MSGNSRQVAQIVEKLKLSRLDEDENQRKYIEDLVGRPFEAMCEILAPMISFSLARLDEVRPNQ